MGLRARMVAQGWAALAFSPLPLLFVFLRHTAFLSYGFCTALGLPALSIQVLGPRTGQGASGTRKAPLPLVVTH